MASTWANIALIFLFIVVGGVFAAAEMALVSLRDSQVKQMSGRGKRGQALASLAGNPNRFLSAVQIGVTLSGFLSAAFGGATLARDLAPVLTGWGVPGPVASTLALVLVTVAISYFSIVLGELTAKRLAMQRAEGFALALAPLVNVIATLTRPVIWFLGASTDVAVKLLGGDPEVGREEVTDEELLAMVHSSVTLGDEERKIEDEVFAAGQVSLREAMVPRTEVDFLSGDTPAHRAIHEVGERAHSRYPVAGSDLDDILGFVHIRDLFDLDHAGRNAPVRQLVRPVMSRPESVRILHALKAMQNGNDHLVIVRDEYGGTAGIVTLEDLVEELIGDITDEFDVVEPDNGVAGTNELDGLQTIEEFAEHFGHRLDDGPYDTVAGYVMARLGRLPQVGDELVASLEVVADPGLPREDFVFRVVELDGRRASRITLTRAAAASAGTA